MRLTTPFSMLPRPWRAQIVIAAATDGAVFFVGMIALVVLSEADPVVMLARIFDEHWRVTAFGLAPASIVVAWRGGADAVRIVSGRASWLRLPLESGAAGAAAVAVLFIVGALDAAWAAGAAFDGIRTWGVDDWLLALRAHAEIAAILASLGFVAGVALTALNRLIVSATSTARPSG